MTTTAPAARRRVARTLNNQAVGALGIAWATVECCRRGWNAMATTRHRAGADLWVDVGNGRAVPVQVKAVAANGGRPHNVSLGKSERPSHEAVLAIVVVDNAAALPSVTACYVMRYADAASAARNYNGCLWLQTADYMRDEHREAWDVIGSAQP